MLFTIDTIRAVSFSVPLSPFLATRCRRFSFAVSYFNVMITIQCTHRRKLIAFSHSTLFQYLKEFMPIQLLLFFISFHTHTERERKSIARSNGFFQHLPLNIMWNQPAKLIFNYRDYLPYTIYLLFLYPSGA